MTSSDRKLWAFSCVHALAELFGRSPNLLRHSQNRRAGERRERRLVETGLVACVVGRCSDGRGSSRSALPRLPHAGVESDGRVVVSSEAVASQHCYRLRWNLRCVHSDCHEVGGVGGKMTGRLPGIRVFSQEVRVIFWCVELRISTSLQLCCVFKLFVSRIVLCKGEWS